MTDFATVRGFEEMWRPQGVRMRRPKAGGLRARAEASQKDVRARLEQLVAHAPEVIVKASGRTRSAAGLRAHLAYVTRQGELTLEGRDGVPIVGRSEIKDLSEDWQAAASLDRRRQSNAPFSHSLVLAMPEGTDAEPVRDAARAFAADVFADSHDFVFALHTDVPHPHVHLSVCSRGDAGQRLHPNIGDLQTWRQIFAQALRDRGVAAEASPRSARGITRRREQTAFRKVRQRYEAGEAEIPRALRTAFMEAAKAAFQGDVSRRPWEQTLLDRQRQIRALYLAQAELMLRSSDPTNRDLARSVVEFVARMPQPDTQRLALARQLRTANARAAEDERRAARSTEPDREKQR